MTGADVHPFPLPSPQAGSGSPQRAQGQALQELGIVGSLPRQDPDIYFLPIIGQIEGHIILPAKNKTTKYEHVIPQLAAIEQDEGIRGVLIILNTVGGDIEAGLAIAELIRGLSKPTVSLVLGGGHSIGAPIAVAADYSFISGTATMTIHPIRLSGMLIGVPQTYEYLDKMQDRIIRFIVANSRISEERLREVMFRTGELMRDVGTVLVGREAVEVGLIDQVGTIADAIAYLRHQMNLRRQSLRAGSPAPRLPGPPPPAPGSPVFRAPAVQAPAWPGMPFSQVVAPPGPGAAFAASPGVPVARGGGLPAVHDFSRGGPVWS